MNKYKLQTKIKEKWMARGGPIIFLGAVILNIIVHTGLDLPDDRYDLTVIFALLLLLICFAMYKSELASALMRDTKKIPKKRK